jgi:hypothetical protein
MSSLIPPTLASGIKHISSAFSSNKITQAAKADVQIDPNQGVGRVFHEPGQHPGDTGGG